MRNITAALSRLIWRASYQFEEHRAAAAATGRLWSEAAYCFALIFVNAADTLMRGAR